MASWFIDRVLPGMVSSAVMVGISHFRLKRHVTKVADAQTAELKGGSDGEGGEA
jgi:hypothetical protein